MNRLNFERRRFVCTKAYFCIIPPLCNVNPLVQLSKKWNYGWIEQFFYFNELSFAFNWKESLFLSNKSRKKFRIKRENFVMLRNILQLKNEAVRFRHFLWKIIFSINNGNFSKKKIFKGKKFINNLAIISISHINFLL